MSNQVAYQKFAESFFRVNPTIGAKYSSPEAIAAVAAQMASNRALPSLTSAELAFRALDLPRVDGKTDADDAQELVDQAQQNLKRVVNEVRSNNLTRDELDYFSGLSQKDLSQLYYANDGFTEFRVRYDLACETFGFVKPLRSSR